MTTDAYAVWLYGSAARGEVDAQSDLDVLLISDRNMTGTGAIRLADRASVSHYSWHEFEALANSGSLFLHHLRLEGRVLQADESGRTRSTEVVSSVGPYRRYRRDLAGFRQVLADVGAAQRYGSTPEYELGVLGTVSRHAAILAAYLVGQPCFSRQRIFEVACEGLGLRPFVAGRLRELYAYRMVLEGRSDTVLSGEWGDVDEAVALVAEFVAHLEDAADDYERAVPSTDCQG